MFKFSNTYNSSTMLRFNYELNNSYNYTTSIISSAFNDYTIHDIRVTTNRVINEFPNSNELLRTSVIKTSLSALFEKSVFPTIGFDPKLLKDPSSAPAAFLNNFMSGSKNLLSYSLGQEYGTRKYEWYKPLIDFSKGLFKMGVLYALPPQNHYYDFRNSAQELFIETAGRFTFDGMHNISSSSGDYLDFHKWSSFCSEREFIANVFRKSSLHFLGVFVGSHVSKLAKELFSLNHFFNNHNENQPNFFHYIALPDFVTDFVSKWFADIVTDFVSKWFADIVNSAFIIPSVRIFTFAINYEQKVIFESKGILECLKLGEAIQKEKDYIAQYKYDLETKSLSFNETSDHFTCESEKHKLTLELSSVMQNPDKTVSIIHYPKSDDKVGQIESILEFATSTKEEKIIFEKGTFVHGVASFFNNLGEVIINASVSTYESFSNEGKIVVSNEDSAKMVNLPHSFNNNPEDQLFNSQINVLEEL